MITLAAARTHSLADISTLPWWVQLLIGLGLALGAVGFATAGDRTESCLLNLIAVLLAFAGISVVCSALFG